MLTASEIMNREIATISGSATVAEAIDLMKEKKTGTLLVEQQLGWSKLMEQSNAVYKVASYGKEYSPQNSRFFYSLVTDKDIVHKVIARDGDPQQILLWEIITDGALSVAPDLAIHEVAGLLADADVSVALVVREKAEGTIAVSDIIMKGC